jgi:hypothetical protein
MREKDRIFFANWFNTPDLEKTLQDRSNLPGNFADNGTFRQGYRKGV